MSNELYLHDTPASINLIPGILESGVEVMLFAGDEDLICNYVGIERTIARMKWSGEQGLSVSDQLVDTVEKPPAVVDD